MGLSPSKGDRCCRTDHWRFPDILCTHLDNPFVDVAHMTKGTNDNDTWTRISLAALRVLTQIEETEDHPAGVEQAADGDSGRSENDRESAENAVVEIILNKKRSA